MPFFLKLNETFHSIGGFLYVRTHLQIFNSLPKKKVLKKAEPQHHPIFGESQFRAKNIFQKQDL